MLLMLKGYNTTEKIQAIVKLHKPINVSQLSKIPSKPVSQVGSTTCVITKGGEVVLDQNL